MNIYIYGLIDPRDGRIRYVGKSVTPRKRLTEHVRQARNGSRLHSRRWIAGLLALTLRPELIVLETCEHNDQANQTESRWIAQLHADLTNRTPGGDGQQKGYKPSRDSIEAARAKLRGQRRTDEQRARLRAVFGTIEERKARRSRVEILKLTNPEWLARVRRGRTGMSNKPETIEKQRASWTPERRAAQSARLKGKPITQRHRDQLAAALQARWAKRRQGAQA